MSYNTMERNITIVLYSFSNKNAPGGGRKSVEMRARPSHVRQFQPPLVVCTATSIAADRWRPIRKQ